MSQPGERVAARGFDFFSTGELPAPRLPAREVAEIVRAAWGLDVELTPLGSQQDQNFLVRARGADQGAEPIGVVKIANPAFSAVELAAQELAAARVASAAPHLRVAVTTTDAEGRSRSILADTSEGRRSIRLIAYLSGGTLTGGSSLSPTVVARLGELAARTSLALADFDHPGLDRVLQWDPRFAADVVGLLARHHASPHQRSTMALADFPRHQLTFGPSPVHPVDRLSDHLGGARVWMKRDDVNSGLAFGGNKTRKLEYLVPDALAKGADTLVSIGGVQSNHTRQVAAVAAHLGMQAVLVQEHWVDWPDAVNDRVGNILLSRLMGADVRLSPAGFGIGFKDSWRQAIADVEERGGTPYAIPAGASDHRLGGLGFANWAHEVAAQEREVGVFFDTIVVCSVTGSTHAGMIAGFADLEQNFGGPQRRVLGIDASAKIDETRDQVARIARNTAALIEVGRELRDDEITVLEGWAGELYGVPVESTDEAMRLTGRLEGVILDPVYEGKSMAGLIDLVTSGEIPRDSNVLYAHLGGQPAINAYSGRYH